MSLLSPGDLPLDVTRFDVESAAEQIAPFVRRTPVIELEPGAFGVPGLLTLKLELLQHTGSFKPRGAFARMLTAEIDDSGVLAASGGNFGLGVAYAASRLGHPAEIFVPSTSPAMKIDKIRGYGATVHVVDGYYADAYAACEDRAWQTGAAFLHPYDQPAVVAGQGTLARELQEQAPALDTVLVAVGGGGLIGGVAAWFASDVRVVGVEPETCPTLQQALATGEPLDVEVGGPAADSLGARRAGRIGFAIARRHVDRVVLVPDDAIVEARRLSWEETKVLPEPGAAAPLAALVSGAYVPAPEERVALVVCGGNANPGDLDMPAAAAADDTD
ncbi:MAG TPA: threonine/serine dehydratase [Actinomycetota bacterium]